MEMLSVDNILQFIVLLSGIFATFIRFNNKTEKNAIMITQLEKDIKNVKEDNERNYTKLELKISEVENDLKSIASDIEK